MLQKSYTFIAVLWLYPGDAAWHFITLPEQVAEDIDLYFSHVKRGWGSLPVAVTIGSSSWKTSIFPDKKTSSYLLPVKAIIRKKERIEAKDELKVTIELQE